MLNVCHLIFIFFIGLACLMLAFEFDVLKESPENFRFFNSDRKDLTATPSNLPNGVQNLLKLDRMVYRTKSEWRGDMFT